MDGGAAPQMASFRCVGSGTGVDACCPRRGSPVRIRAPAAGVPRPDPAPGTGGVPAPAQSPVIVVVPEVPVVRVAPAQPPASAAPQRRAGARRVAGRDPRGVRRPSRHGTRAHPEGAEPRDRERTTNRRRSGGGTSVSRRPWCHGLAATHLRERGRALGRADGGAGAPEGRAHRRRARPPRSGARRPLRRRSRAARGGDGVMRRRLLALLAALAGCAALPAAASAVPTIDVECERVVDMQRALVRRAPCSSTGPWPERRRSTAAGRHRSRRHHRRAPGVASRAATAPRARRSRSRWTSRRPP